MLVISGSRRSKTSQDSLATELKEAEKVRLQVMQHYRDKLGKVGLLYYQRKDVKYLVRPVRMDFWKPSTVQRDAVP
jgi:hypothetical protein